MYKTSIYNLFCKYNSFLIQVKIILIVLDKNHQLQFYMLNEMCLFESQITLLTVHFEWWVFSTWKIFGSIILKMLTMFRWFLWNLLGIPFQLFILISHHTIHYILGLQKEKTTQKNKESIKQKHSEFKGILIFLLFTNHRSIYSR